MIAAADDAANASQRPAIFLVQAATPDVSSTEIRERMRRGETIHGLVPPLVEAISVNTVSIETAHAADHLHGQN